MAGVGACAVLLVFFGAVMPGDALTLVIMAGVICMALYLVWNMGGEILRCAHVFRGS